MRRIRANRAQIRKHAQSLANSQQPFFGPLLGWCIIEFRETDSAHEGRVGGGGKFRRLVGEGGAGLMNGDAAEQPFGQIQRVIPLVRDMLQHAHSFAGNLGADAVTGEDEDVEVH